MDIVYGILLDNGAGYNAKCDSSLGLRVGDYCVIRKDFYLDYGQIVKQYDSPPPEPPRPAPSEDGQDATGSSFAARKNEIHSIQRKATVVDQGKAHENRMRAKSALRITGQYVAKLGLPMKLINAHYSYDGKLITVQFSAEGRVDFRELVKLLSQEFNTHIELRQIGVRDETSILGGIANCGRPLCCCQFLKEFASINVKMAKEQDLSLTPSTISGICGRLKCCLKYEHEGYLELEKTMPRRGELCECKEGRGRIVDRNLLTQKVTVQLGESNHTVVCPASEVSVVYLDKYKVHAGQDDSQAAGQDDSASTETPSAAPRFPAEFPAPAGPPERRPQTAGRRKQPSAAVPASERRPQAAERRKPQQRRQPSAPSPAGQPAGQPSPAGAGTPAGRTEQSAGLTAKPSDICTPFRGPPGAAFPFALKPRQFAEKA